MVQLFGLGLCAWAYLRCRKSGYLILGAYFFVTAGWLVFGPAINHAIREYSHRRSPEVLSPEAQKQYMAEIAALNEKYYPTGRVAQSHVSFPLGPIVLVAGLWVIARREPKKITEQDAAPNSRPPSQLPTSPEVQSSDSQRTSSSGGCG